MLKKNGYVLEQLYSPLIVHTTPEHMELKEIAKGCITKHHSHHYFGFAETQWKLFDKERPRRVKPLLYVYRVLLTGLHLMRTGVVNANLVELNEEARLPYIADLIARKQSGEHTTLEDADVAFHQREYERLKGPTTNVIISRSEKRTHRQSSAGLLQRDQSLRRASSRPKKREHLWPEQLRAGFRGTVRESNAAEVRAVISNADSTILSRFIRA